MREFLTTQPIKWLSSIPYRNQSYSQTFFFYSHSTWSDCKWFKDVLVKKKQNTIFQHLQPPHIDTFYNPDGWSPALQFLQGKWSAHMISYWLLQKPLNVSKHSALPNDHLTHAVTRNLINIQLCLFWHLAHSRLSSQQQHKGQKHTTHFILSCAFPSLKLSTNPSKTPQRNLISKSVCKCCASGSNNLSVPKWFKTTLLWDLINQFSRMCSYNL